MEPYASFLETGIALSTTPDGLKEEWARPAEKYSENVRGSVEALKRVIELEVSMHGQLPVALCLLDVLASLGLKIERNSLMEALRSNLKNKALTSLPPTAPPDTPGLLDHLFRKLSRSEPTPAHG